MFYADEEIGRGDSDILDFEPERIEERKNMKEEADQKWKNSMARRMIKKRRIGC